MSKVSKYLIYALHHPGSLHVYVGKSSSGMARPRMHGTPSSLKKHAHYPVSRWIKKHRAIEIGWDYQIVVLEECVSAAALDEAEQFYIAYFRATKLSLLNISDGGGGGFTGGKHTSATRAKISAVHKGRKFSDEHRRNLSATSAITNATPEMRMEWAKKNANRKVSPETRAKMSENAKRLITPERLAEMRRLAAAIPFTDERRAAIAARVTKQNLKRGSHTEETKAKISKALIGRHPSDESRAKMSRGRLGIRPSEETRAKRSLSMRGVCARRKRESAPRIRVNLLFPGVRR